MRTFRRSAVTALAVAALAVPTGIASADPGTPATPAAQLLLTQGEFPAGYRVEKVSANEFGDITSKVGDALTAAKVTPAQCMPVVSRSAIQRAAGTPIVVALNEAKQTGISEMLTHNRIDNATVIPKGCETVHMEFPVRDGSAVMDVRSSVVSLPGAPSGAKTVLARSTGTVTVKGTVHPIKQEQIIGAQQVRGYGVLLVGTAVGGEAPATVDRAGFAQALTAATNKVRTAR
ncbi:hypothetical protein [Tsukamurella pseudospumae]|uniref:DUF5642 domain-containing protein n=1 Tax=Tsukamurella pseudospumae TaxID=239498 RepID=A0A138A3J4_9ACTN|nr:hypothetical protein [Tsukamurella pseudospumae]KXP05012.1 hypothetical protein AXK60_12640 [Tsukamurella pseudospumae]